VIVERAFREGHRIGSHSYSHPDLSKLSEAGVRKQLLDTEKLIGEFLTETKLFRPPYGAHNSTVDKVARDLGYTTLLWSVDSNDWRAENRSEKWIKPSVDTIRQRGHSIFLCHDIHKSTVENIPAFLTAVRKVPKANFIGYA
jgi:peptidoglycan/xylan/chitin deacetylase (PgdA/CDA1 family)